MRARAVKIWLSLAAYVVALIVPATTPGSPDWTHGLSRIARSIVLASADPTRESALSHLEDRGPVKAHGAGVTCSRDPCPCQPSAVGPHRCCCVGERELRPAGDATDGVIDGPVVCSAPCRSDPGASLDLVKRLPPHVPLGGSHLCLLTVGYLDLSTDSLGPRRRLGGVEKVPKVASLIRHS